MTALTLLRQQMQQHQLDAWIIPSADPHLSEYLPAHWQTRRYVSGFTGSVGTLVVTQNEAGLWVDSRYWLQAEQQLQGTEIQLQKLGLVEDYPQWLVTSLAEKSRVGVAPDMLSLHQQRLLTGYFSSKQIELVSQYDLVDKIWQERPSLPQSEIFPQAQCCIVESISQKLAKIRLAMVQQQADYHLISSLDDIAWITNLRGSDVEYNPVFLSHLLMNQQQVWLFVDKNRCNSDSLAMLQKAGITLCDYGAITQHISQLSGKLLLDPYKIAVSIIKDLPLNVQLIEQINPSTLLKSVKCEAEISHIRQAMVQDGVALCGFFAELEQRLANHIKTTEWDIDAMLYQHRCQQPHFISASFGSIIGFNGNGAMPHYRPTENENSEICGQGLLLIDSGAQYHNGTTDLTRVIAIGEPTSMQKKDYTLVLKAHIALAQAVFPQGISAPLLDVICRQPLWQAQCDYGHGTGHGVGYCLNVHEGPQVINYRTPIQPQHSMKIGMVTSNEPGLYRTGKWGIRIENLVVNQKVAIPQERDFGEYLCFETMTLCPIDTTLIERTLLTTEEIKWLNQYHHFVRTQLAPHTQGIAKAWLIANTQEI